MGINLHYTEYHAALPYPEVQVESENIRYVQLLQDDYSGLTSEFTAISQYTYHQLILENTNNEIAAIFKGIALVETKHLELLGRAIIKLGGNPVFRSTYSNTGRYWYGSYVNYSNTIKKILHDNINAERVSISTYYKHIEVIHDSYIQELLKRIVMDEELHLAILLRVSEENICEKKLIPKSSAI